MMQENIHTMTILWAFAFPYEEQSIVTRLYGIANPFPIQATGPALGLYICSTSTGTAVILPCQARIRSAGLWCACTAFFMPCWMNVSGRACG